MDSIRLFLAGMDALPCGSPAPQKNSLPLPASHPPRPTAPCPFYWLNRIVKNFTHFYCSIANYAFFVSFASKNAVTESSLKISFLHDPKNKHYIKTYIYGPKLHLNLIIVKGKITSYLVYFQEHNCQSKISLSISV